MEIFRCKCVARVDVLMSHFPPFFREGTLKSLGKVPMSLEGIVDSCGIRAVFVWFFLGGNIFHLEVAKTKTPEGSTWMSQEVSKWLVSGL